MQFHLISLRKTSNISRWQTVSWRCP